MCARVLLAQADDLARAGLRFLLARDADLDVVGEARDGLEALDLATTLAPDLVLMDLHLPRLDGLEATRALKRSRPTISVVVLSVTDDCDLVLQAVRAGAVGWCVTGADEADLRAAIRQALGVEPRVAPARPRRSAHPEPRTTAHPLSPREHEVLRLLARGKTNGEIAAELQVTLHTVKVHVEHILVKLGVNHRTQAAVQAIELGYIEAPGVGHVLHSGHRGADKASVKPGLRTTLSKS